MKESKNRNSHWSKEEMEAIATVNRIALNLEWMGKLLKETALVVIIICTFFTTSVQAREITSEEMKEIMKDTNCLVVEIEETKKSLALERQETDKYIALSNELNAKNKELRQASKGKRWGGIALGLLVGVGIGALATR